MRVDRVCMTDSLQLTIKSGLKRPDSKSRSRLAAHARSTLYWRRTIRWSGARGRISSSGTAGSGSVAEGWITGRPAAGSNFFATDRGRRETFRCLSTQHGIPESSWRLVVPVHWVSPDRWPALAAASWAFRRLRYALVLSLVCILRRDAASVVPVQSSSLCRA